MLQFGMLRCTFQSISKITMCGISLNCFTRCPWRSNNIVQIQNNFAKLNEKDRKRFSKQMNGILLCV